MAQWRYSSPFLKNHPIYKKKNNQNKNTKATINENKKKWTVKVAGCVRVMIEQHCFACVTLERFEDGEYQTLWHGGSLGAKCSRHGLRRRGAAWHTGIRCTVHLGWQTPPFSLSTQCQIAASVLPLQVRGEGWSSSGETDTGNWRSPGKTSARTEVLSIYVVKWSCFSSVLIVVSCFVWETFPG